MTICSRCERTGQIAIRFEIERLFGFRKYEQNRECPVSDPCCPLTLTEPRMAAADRAHRKAVVFRALDGGCFPIKVKAVNAKKSIG